MFWVPSLDKGDGTLGERGDPPPPYNRGPPPDKKEDEDHEESLQTFEGDPILQEFQETTLKVTQDKKGRSM